MNTRKIFVITMILVMAVISTVNIYLAKPNASLNMVTLNNIGMTQENNTESGIDPIPSGGCAQLETEKSEKQNGYWYKKIITWSCTSGSTIQYCKVGTQEYHCTYNCMLNEEQAGWNIWGEHTWSYLYVVNNTQLKVSLIEQKGNSSLLSDNGTITY
jgi:hypothetical protein